MSKRLTKEEFIIRAKKLHGDKYSYENSDYISMLKKIRIKCYDHGNFLQTPADHVWGKGHGCPKCKADKASCNVTDIKEKFNEVHGLKYQYDWSTYTRNSIKMKMVCSDHGEFWQKPELHKAGAGCKKCTASGGPGKYCETLFSRRPELKSKPGFLYFVELHDSDNTKYFKIGITMSIRTRFYNSLKKNGGKFLWTHSDTLYNCFLLEQKMLLLNSNFKYLPKHFPSGGKTECFTKEIKYDDIREDKNS